MIAVERVSATGEVHVVLQIPWHEEVMGSVIDAPERESWPLVIAFLRMIEHHVQNYFDAGPVQRLHHIAEFPQVAAALGAHAKSGLRRKITYRAIPPIVSHGSPVDLTQDGRLIEVEYRQQLHRRHTEVLQVRDLLDDPQECSRAPYSGGRRLRKSS